MKKKLAFGLVALVLAGCGTHVRTGTGFTPGASIRALTRATIVDAPGIVVGVEQKVAGKYKIHKITGLGTVKAFDENRLDVASKLSAKVGPVTVTKNVTFQITRRDDATWPYRFLAVNTTDKETFDNFMAVCDLLDNIFSGYKVEVVTTGGLSPYIGPHILNSVEYVQIAN